MKKPEIKKIVIEVGGKRLDFTPEEAKELKSLLAELFGADVEKHFHHGYYSWPWYTGTTTTAPYSPSWGTTYCGGSGTLTLTGGSNVSSTHASL